MDFQIVTHKNNEVKIAQVQYGQLVYFQGRPYIKVNKETGRGLITNWPRAHSILLNPKLGTLRAVPWDTFVQILSVKSNEVYLEEDPQKIKEVLK